MKQTLFYSVILTLPMATACKQNAANFGSDSGRNEAPAEFPLFHRLKTTTYSLGAVNIANGFQRSACMPEAVPSEGSGLVINFNILQAGTTISLTGSTICGHVAQEAKKNFVHGKISQYLDDHGITKKLKHKVFGPKSEKGGFAIEIVLNPGRYNAVVGVNLEEVLPYELPNSNSRQILKGQYVSIKDLRLTASQEIEVLVPKSGVE